MITSFRGSLAAAALCATLAACGGGSSPPAPTALPASVAIASDARVEAGAQERFATDLAVTAGLSFRWDFGDGSTGAGATASHAYAKPGIYQVTLAVANDAEDLRTATSSIQVGAYSNVTGLDCTQPGSAGWCWQHAIVTGHQVNDVFFLDATHAWAVGDALTILKSVDGGNAWTRSTVDSALAAASLRSVRFYDTLHGMALSDQGSALQTSDGGSTWTLANLGNTLYNGQATFVEYGPSRIILESQYAGNAAMSVDGGGTWTQVAASGAMQATASDCWSFNSYQVQRAAGCGATATSALTVSSGYNGYQYFLAGTFASAQQGIVLGYGYSYDTYTSSSLVWTTADGGASWTSFQASGLPPYYYFSGQMLHLNDALVGLAYLANDLSAYSTQDGGHTWAAVTPSVAVSQSYNGYRSTGFIGNVMWQSSGNHLSISPDLGQTWHDAVIHEEDAAAIYGQSTATTVTQYSDADNWVVSTSHRFYVTHDAGQTFKRLLGPDSRDANAATATGFFFDLKNGKFLTANGVLLSTADGGRTWTRLDYPTTAGTPVALHFTSTTEGWLLLGGKLAHSTDGGATWSTPLTNSTMTNLQGMSWGDATHAWTWNYGTLFATADAGATWAPLVLPANVAVNSAVMTGPQGGVVGSAYGGYQTTQDGGATWQANQGNSGYGVLVHTTGQTVWSISNATTRSKDGGRTWHAAGPANYGVTVTGLAFTDESHGWMVTNGGNVLRTIDGGDTWSAQVVGTDLALAGIVAVDSMTAWVITRDGQVLATATAGN
jgi:photosystem II stability/assembly factor-like uncharacterized protein